MFIGNVCNMNGMIILDCSGNALVYKDPNICKMSFYLARYFAEILSDTQMCCLPHKANFE